MDSTKLTVIIVNKNDALGLTSTLGSLKTQELLPEVVVIDGGSKDGSLHVIAEYSDLIDYWSSEPDNGVYDAMNKGIGLINADFHLFLNSGDYLEGSVLTQKISRPGFLPVMTRDLLGRCVRMRPKSRLRGMPYCHQGIVFESRGLRFDPRYKISADYDYFLRHGYGKDLPQLNVPGHVVYGRGGVSDTAHVSRDLENQLILIRHFGSLKAIPFGLETALKIPIRILRWELSD